jgi:hypothetical protein
LTIVVARGEGGVGFAGFVRGVEQRFAQAGIAGFGGWPMVFAVA